MKKMFLVIIMLITSLIAKPLNGDIDSTNENIVQNTITEEISVLEAVQEEKEIIEPVQEENIVDINDEIVVKEEKIIQDNKEPIKENKTSQNSNAKSKSNIQEQQTIEVKEESKPQPKQEPKPVEQAVVETKPKQEEKIYCVDGGKIHIYGDGANEHGYYKTWDEAFSAYEEYTKGWESTQFKVDQCACGLYYFWVIK